MTAGEPADTEDGELQPGALLGTRYRIESIIGTGAAGAVYRAIDLAIGIRIAVKVMLPVQPDREALAREVAFARLVTHRNICRTYDLEEIDGHHIITMEYVAGTTLADRLATGEIPLADALEIATQIARGLEAAHAQGIVYRDLKPQNVMLEAGTGRVVLMDFGISHAASDVSEEPRGTPAYMAPETWTGGPIDGRADLYALGCVMHQMVSGQRPFEAALPADWRRRHTEDAPPALRAPRRVARLVRDLLAKDPARRPRDASAVLHRLAPRWRTRVIAPAGAVVAVAGIAAIASRHGREWHPEIRPRAPVYDENGDSLAISHDGKWLAYDSDRDGSWRVWIEPLAGGEARPVTPPDLVSVRPRFTHDDRALLVQHIDRMGAWPFPGTRFERVPLDGTRPELVADRASAADECLDTLVLGFDADGRAPGRIVARDHGGERVVATLGSSAHLGHLRCSGDGRSFLVTIVDPELDEPGAQIFLGTLDGAPLHRITHGHAAHRATFHPDGRSVFYSSDDGASVDRIWEQSLAGGPPRLVVGGAETYNEPLVTPDGSTLFYCTDTSAMPLFRLDLATGTSTPLVRPLESIFGGAAACRGRVAVATNATVFWRKQLHIVLVDPATHVDRELGDGWAVASTPDGNEIVYSRGGPERSEVYAVGCDGGAPRLVTTVHGLVRRLAIGQGVVHIAATGTWRVPLAGGDAVPEGAPPLEYVIPSPTSAHVLAARGGRLYLVQPGHALDDPEAQAFDTDLAAWSPDGAAFYYVSGRAIVRHELGSGEERVVLRNATSVGTLAPSLDGGSLYFTAIVGHVRRQMVVNFADRPRP